MQLSLVVFLSKSN